MYQVIISPTVHTKSEPKEVEGHSAKQVRTSEGEGEHFFFFSHKLREHWRQDNTEVGSWLVGICKDWEASKVGGSQEQRRRNGQR